MSYEELMAAIITGLIVAAIFLPVWAVVNNLMDRWMPRK